MAKVIFMHFDTQTDGVYDAKIGEPIVRLAKEKMVPIPFSNEGDYSKCLISVENLSNEEPTSYMEDEEFMNELARILAKFNEYENKYK